MSRPAQTAAPLDERERYSNRARFLEEVSHGITRLLRASKKNQAWLARRLNVAPSQISQILEGSHNFKLETLADVGLAFDRAAHLVWGVDLNEMRFPVDEAESRDGDGTCTSFKFPDDHDPIRPLRRIPGALNEPLEPTRLMTGTY